jgi:hypothetical protein
LAAARSPHTPFHRSTRAAVAPAATIEISEVCVRASPASHAYRDTGAVLRKAGSVEMVNKFPPASGHNRAEVGR